MSTRYVWGKWDKTLEYIPSIQYGGTGTNISTLKSEAPGTPTTIYVMQSTSYIAELKDGVLEIGLTGNPRVATSFTSDPNSGSLYLVSRDSGGQMFVVTNDPSIYKRKINVSELKPNTIRGDGFVIFGHETYSRIFIWKDGSCATMPLRDENNRGATANNIGVGWTAEDVKGSLLGHTSGPSQSTSPADGVSGNYWYTYLGSDNIDPTAVGYSTTTPKGGENITIRVTARSNTYGGTISYRYQYSINGGQSWTDAGTTTATSKTVTVPKGAPTFQARVLASDNMGFTSSTWVTGAKLTVTNNTAPTISGTDGDLGTFALTPPQAVSYTINDADGNTVAVTVTLDGATVASFNATLGQANSYSIPGDRWLETLNGKHTIKITANDGQGGSAVRTYTFTKNVTTMSVQLAQPLPADAMITKAAETILASLPAGTKTKVEICNNGFDAAPTWEDVTVRALAGEKLFLANTKNTAGKWGYNIRVTVERGTAQGEVSLTSIAGFFE